MGGLPSFSKYDILITNAILYHPGGASLRKIIQLVKKLDNLATYKIIQERLGNTNLFLKSVAVSGSKSLWEVTDEWKLQLAEENLGPSLQFYAARCENIAKQYENTIEHITEAIFGHWGERATASKIYDFLQRKFKVSRRDRTTWMILICYNLMRHEVFKILPKEMNEKKHRWTVAEEWKLQFKKHIDNSSNLSEKSAAIGSNTNIPLEESLSTGGMAQIPGAPENDALKREKIPSLKRKRPCSVEIIGSAELSNNMNSLFFEETTPNIKRARTEIEIDLDYITPTLHTELPPSVYLDLFSPADFPIPPLTLDLPEMILGECGVELPSIPSAQTGYETPSLECDYAMDFQEKMVVPSPTPDMNRKYPTENLHKNLDWTLPIAEAILSNQHDQSATVDEIFDYFMENHRSFCEKIDKTVVVHQINYCLLARNAFLEKRSRRRAIKWIVAPEWKERFERQLYFVTPICSQCQQYVPRAGKKSEIPDKLRTYSSYITAAILSHPEEQATVYDIRLFLHENFEWFRNLSEKLRCRILGKLNIKEKYKSISHKSRDPKWTITDEWRKRFQRSCGKCMMVEKIPIEIATDFQNPGGMYPFVQTKMGSCTQFNLPPSYRNHHGVFSPTVSLPDDDASTSSNNSPPTFPSSYTNIPCGNLSRYTNNCSPLLPCPLMDLVPNSSGSSAEASVDYNFGFSYSFEANLGPLENQEFLNFENQPCSLPWPSLFLPNPLEDNVQLRSPNLNNLNTSWKVHNLPIHLERDNLATPMCRIETEEETSDQYNPWKNLVCQFFPDIQPKSASFSPVYTAQPQKEILAAPTEGCRNSVEKGALQRLKRTILFRKNGNYNLKKNLGSSL